MISKTMKMPRTLYGEATGIAPGLLLSIVISQVRRSSPTIMVVPNFFMHCCLVFLCIFFLTMKKCGAGIEFAAKKLVRIGVALLGVRIAYSDVSTIGLDGVGILAGAVV